MPAEFALEVEALADYLRDFRARSGRTLIEPSAYEKLPFEQTHFEWRLRRHDLALVTRLMERSNPSRALDVGAWNGWLSNRLATAGYEVTAVDYFDDPYDGLGAGQFYRATWRSIQMDLTDLSLLEERFELVILNRCLAFFGDPLAQVMEAKKMLAPGGLLIITGLQFFADPAAHRRHLKEERRLFKERYGRDLLLRPAKGYLDLVDAKKLQAAGVSLRIYRGLPLAHLRAFFNKKAPRHTYGLLRAELG
jgi:SAM-dependent methyltransferase